MSNKDTLEELKEKFFELLDLTVKKTYHDEIWQFIVDNFVPKEMYRDLSEDWQDWFNRLEDFINLREVED